MAKINLEDIKSAIINMDEKKRYYIFAGALVLVFILDYLILMRPQLKALATKNPEIKVQQDNIDRATADINKVVQYKKEVSDLRDKVDKANLKVKSKEEVPLILEKISRIAYENAVNIGQIMPYSVDQRVILSNNSRKFYSVPIFIDGRSSYHDFGKFVNTLENDDISMAVENFTITSGSDEAMHDFHLEIKAVVFEEIVSK